MKLRSPGAGETRSFLLASLEDSVSRGGWLPETPLEPTACEVVLQEREETKSNATARSSRVPVLHGDAARSIVTSGA